MIINKERKEMGELLVNNLFSKIISFYLIEIVMIVTCLSYLK